MYYRFSIILICSFFCSTVFAQNIPNNSTAPAATARKLPAIYSNGVPTNFVRVYTAQKPLQDTSLLNMNSLVEEVSAVTMYADGYGRQVQTVAKQMSPGKKDNVSAIVYDEFGRTPVQYPSFASNSGNSTDGNFKANPFFQDSVFYKSFFPAESINYSQIFYDGSPCNIPIKSLAPGNSWGGNSIGPVYSSRSNVAGDSVVLWTITNVTEDDMPVKWGFYAAGSLIVKQVEDERGIKSITYTDNLGKTILSKTQLIASPSSGHAGWLCTYYVYDEMGRLRVVIPPKATEILNNSWNFSTNNAVFNNLCFVYSYDSRSRQIMKRIPGKGKSYIAYDLKDRVVMTQDPRLRLTNQWAFVLYDAQSRPLQSGLITSALIKDSIIAQASRSLAYPTLSGTYTITAESYYDDYAWVSGTGGAITNSFITTNINSSNFVTAYNSSPLYAQSVAAGLRTRGALTGSKKIILNSSNYLYTIQYYDAEGRPVQTKQTNYSNGTDVATVQYDFSGKLLRSHLEHQKGGTNAQTHTVLYKYNYDHAGRALSTMHKLDNLAEKTISNFVYNEMGQVQNKSIGSGVDIQNYAYNIRGMLTSINKDFVSGAITPLTAGGFFGEIISYDFGFTNNQVNGNIAGIKWKACGDTTTRAYGFTYDNANRLTTAYYSQAGTGWVNNVVDYSTNNLTYDANGNILTMKQRGLGLGSSVTIDSLTYQYFTTSNTLQKVIDGMPAITGNRGDFQDTSLTSDDYVYDANGNTVKDNNRHMHTTANGNGAVFNVLDKADSISIAGKSGTYYYYDAGGSLLRKQVNKYGAGGSTKNYLYIGGFVYVNDTLQYALHNEGCVRYARKINSATGVAYYAYEYDYYIKDRQGNIRTVLTEGRDTAIYQATVEPSRQGFEDSLFSNIYSPVSTWVLKSTIPSFDSDGSNTKVIKLNSGGNKTGAGITLKVMAGDKVQLNCYAYFNTAVQPPAPVSLLNDILPVLSSGIVNNSGGKIGTSEQSSVSSLLSPNVTSFLDNRAFDPAKPKAYLNWVLFDNQFKFIQGGVVQVLTGSTKQALVAPLQTVSKNGYLYVYVSNESPQDVFFDDVTVKHYTGPLVQEQSYYPFGLQMAAISEKALKKNGTPYKYNGGSEFEDELNYYGTFYRKYDAQVGRFTGIDILAEETANLTPFNFGNGNPIMFNDPSGAFNTLSAGRMQKGYDGNYHVGWVNEIMWNNIGFFSDAFWGDNSDGDGGGGGGNFRNIMGVSSTSIMNQLGFGDNFGKNKNGEYGFWRNYIFHAADRGIQLAGPTENTSGEVLVGSGRTWIGLSSLPYQGWNIPTAMQQGGSLPWLPVWQQSGDRGGEKRRNFIGFTSTNKASTEKGWKSGWGDEINMSYYEGVVSGEEGSLLTFDVSTNYGEIEGGSVTIGGIVTFGIGVDASLSLGVGMFGYEVHTGIGIGNGLGQFSAGGSYLSKRGAVTGGDMNFKIGGAYLITAAAATFIISTGGVGAVAFN